MVFHAFAVRHVEQGQAFDPYFVRSRVPFLSRLLVSNAKVARRYRAARSIARELECRDSRRRLRRMRLILRSGSMAMIVASRLAFDATKRENSPTLAPMSKNTNGRPDALSISVASSAS
jgi:hypothetical protein